MLRVVGVDILGLSSWHRRRIKTEEKAKVVADVQGTELIQFLAALAIFHQDDLKKRMNRITATWRNGCFGKMDDYLVHTIPNHHLTKMDGLSKTVVQIILNGQCGLQVRPPTNSDDLFLLFCLYPSSMLANGGCGIFQYGLKTHELFGLQFIVQIFIILKLLDQILTHQNAPYYTICSCNLQLFLFYIAALNISLKYRYHDV